MTLTGGHRAAANTVAAGLATNPETLVVVLHGSTVRGEALAGSDVDLAVVIADSADAPPRLHRVGDLEVEVIARTEAAWRDRFARPQPSWLYAFLEGELLVDRGPGARLIAAAHDGYADYRTPREATADLADRLGHGHAKLARALAHPDDAAAGYWASVMLVDAIPEVLYALSDRPLPPPSRRFELLGDLPLATAYGDLLDGLCTGTPRVRLHAAADLVATLGPRLAALSDDPSRAGSRGTGERVAGEGA